MAGLITLAACGGTTERTPGAIAKRITVRSSIGELQPGSPVYRTAADGELLDTTMTGSDGVASVGVDAGQAVSVRELDSLAAPTSSQLITVIGFDDTPELRLGGIDNVRNATDQTVASIEGLPDGVNALVISSCDATTLSSARPSATFNWYDGCQSGSRMMIAETDEAVPRYAVGYAMLDQPLVFASWSTMPPVQFTLPAGYSVFELSVTIEDGDRGVRRFFVDNANQPFGVPPLGRWRAEAWIYDANGDARFWFAVSDPTTAYTVAAADLPTIDQIATRADGITLVVDHDRASDAPRRTELAFGTAACLSGNLVWTVIDDGTAASITLPEIAPELATVTAAPLAGYISTVAAGATLEPSATIAALAERSTAPGLDLISLAIDARPVTAAVHQVGLPCD